MLLKELFAFSVINFSVISNNFVESCSMQCRKFTYKPYLERVSYLVKLPDYKKLNDLALIGTHLSFSYSASKTYAITQDLNIVQQLKYGIRVLDIGIRPQFNIFEVQAEYAKTNVKFSDVLTTIDKFLDYNPGEFIIMFLRQNYPSDFGVTLSNCEILNYYIKSSDGAGKRLVKNWKLTDTIGKHRGKILLASLDYSFKNCTFDVNRQCYIQNDDVIYRKSYTTINTKDKLKHITETLKASYSKSYKCYINDISFFDIHFDRRIVARDGGYDYQQSCPMPLNYVMTQRFANPHRALIIVMADYPSQELMDKINDSNFRNSSWRSGWE
ncbi:uncharacterized protein LOC130673463 [Microplitis mediator]|uniref:uncharacterized protein LOC130673463 n=1 Tax=Microplitis mediator TaxID=375433 RepID=UPI0025543FBA|nr:uncharacterized protein LOC130673463 [Microplitis mediator]